MDYKKLWDELKEELTTAKATHDEVGNDVVKSTMESTLLIMQYLENKQKQERNKQQESK